MIELEKLRSASPANTSSRAQSPQLQRFLRLYSDYSQERALAKTWADSYQPAIDAHFHAAERYEKTQLVAEIGIVIASLAVLLTNRAAWLISIACATVCVVMLANTFLMTRSAVARTNETIEQSGQAYQELRKAHLAANEDKRTVEQLDPGGNIRAAIQAETSAKPR